MERIPYNEACKGLLQKIADGKYWYLAGDFMDGRSFDSQALQAKKASAVLDELATQIAKFPDPETLSKEHCGDGSSVDVQAQIMLLRINAGSKFMNSITRAATISAPEVKEPEREPSLVEEVIDESELTGAQKLQRAKDSVAGML
jgi:hypothetical protein